jgi:hypothetical protein
MEILQTGKPIRIGYVKKQIPTAQSKQWESVNTVRIQLTGNALAIIVVAKPNRRISNNCPIVAGSVYKMQ